MSTTFNLEKSDAEGGILYGVHPLVRVRRAGTGERAHTIVLEVWTGRYWGRKWSTDEMSNDYAYSEMRDRAMRATKEILLVPPDQLPSEPPRDLVI